MSKTFPKNFVSRRWHSFLGLWMVIYLLEHLLTNSQAALPFSQDGGGFIHAVNAIQRLPYIKVIEICLIGVPFLWHGISGVRYLFTAKYNSFSSKHNPSLTKYSANHAYTWQRIAAWVLLVGITLHVIQMRFLDYPSVVHRGGGEATYVVRISMDTGLSSVAKRMNIQLYDQAAINAAIAAHEAIVPALLKKPLKPGKVLAASSEFGKVVLLNVRDTFKSPLMMILYSFFVLAAIYHGFRGLWSFCIVWGATLTKRSQTLMAYGSIGLMILMGALGFAAIWLTYWVTLRH